MNDVYLWNQKTECIKLIQDIDLNRVYTDFQRRGLFILAIDLNTLNFK